MGQVVDAVLFLVGQTVNLREIAQFESFYVLSGQFSVVTVVDGCLFVTFVVNDRYFYPVELSVGPPKFNV